MIREILAYWLKQILYAILLLVGVLIVGLIILFSGNTQGRYLDYADTYQQ